MKAILINPFERSLTTIDIDDQTVPSLLQMYKFVGEDGLDFAYVAPGEAIAVGDHSALADPPLPSWRFAGYQHPFYGRGVAIGHTSVGKGRDTRFTVDTLSQLIEFS